MRGGRKLVNIRQEGTHSPAYLGDPANDAAQILTGTLRRSFDLDGARSGCCVLVTDDGEVFRLNTFDGSERDWAKLDAASFNTLAQFESLLVEVTYDRREDSVFGPNLWGVRVRPLS